MIDVSGTDACGNPPSPEGDDKRAVLHRATAGYDDDFPIGLERNDSRPYPADSGWNA